MGKSRKNNGNVIRRVILSMLFLFLLSCLGISIYFGYTLGKINEGAVKLGENTSDDISITEVKSKKSKKNKCLNVLVMGVDIGNPNSRGKNNPKRTDTIILANYNLDTGKINLISIPRDTYIQINGVDYKINAAHVIGGVPYLVEAVEQLLDIKINYYGKVDYSGFRDLIDAIGGIDMEIARRMDYDDSTQNLHIHFKKGTVAHLDGKKAEEFFRWRKNNDGTGFSNGDIGRIENQHKFISKVFEKFKSPSIIPKIPSILSIIPDYVETNMSVDEVIKYGWEFAKVDTHNIEMITLNGTARYENGISYFFYDEGKNFSILKLIHGEDYSYIDKKELKIKIANCTNKGGLAGDFSNYIKKIGYTNTYLFNGEKMPKSKIIFNGVDEEIIDIVKKDFHIANVEINSSKQQKFDIMVLLGNDHNYIN